MELTPQGNPSRKDYHRQWRAKRRAILAKTVNAVQARAAAAPVVTVSDLVLWIEGNLKVPTGPLSGRPFICEDFQREWLSGALADGVREAGMSIARKNGKSGFIAALLLAGLIGPWNAPGWRAVVSSMTGLLAKELMEAIIATAKASNCFDELTLRRAPPPGHLLGANGARVDFLAADRATGHAVGADLALIDEAGLLQENQRALWNALYSSISGRDGRFWGISIQGDGPMFAEMELRAETDQVYWRRWSAPEGCDLADEKAWHAANPGLNGRIKSADYMRDAASRAMIAQGNELHFRAYDLNQSVDPGREIIVSLADYKACRESGSAELEGDLIVAWDLGGSASMTAAAAYSVDTGALRVWGAFGDDPPLSHRARRDRMGTLYDRMVREGQLRIMPGRVTPVVEFMRSVLDEVSEKGRIIAMGADRYRKAEAQQAFDAAEIPRHIKTFWRGQGASAKADGSHDVRAFQKAILDRKLRLEPSTMLEAAIAQSSIRYDTSGNPALDKAGKEARIDALSAAVIAVGIGAAVQTGPLFKVSVV